MDHDTPVSILRPASIQEMVQELAENEDSGGIGRSRICRLFAGLIDRLGFLSDYPSA
jgi:hypothetical protein